MSIGYQADHAGWMGFTEPAARFLAARPGYHVCAWETSYFRTPEPTAFKRSCKGLKPGNGVNHYCFETALNGREHGLASAVTIWPPSCSRSYGYGEVPSRQTDHSEAQQLSGSAGTPRFSNSSPEGQRIIKVPEATSCLTGKLCDDLHVASTRCCRREWN